MKITNKNNLPEELVKACSGGVFPPKAGRIGVTELIDSPQIRKLKHKHWDELSEDVSDRMWAMFGTAVHLMLEPAKPVFVSQEIDGLILTGKLDRYDGKVLRDYKVTSAWSIVYDSRKADWVNQLNVYRWLLIKNGQTDPESIEIVAMLRDWSKTKAMADSNYPQSQTLVIPIQKMTMDALENYVEGRIALHKMNMDCTAEERWAAPDKWAVKVEGRKTALRVFDDEVLAQQMLEKSGPKHFIEKRPGMNRRCEEYCAVASHCSQFKALKESQMAVEV